MISGQNRCKLNKETFESNINDILNDKFNGFLYKLEKYAWGVLKSTCYYKNRIVNQVMLDYNNINEKIDSISKEYILELVSRYKKIIDDLDNIVYKINNCRNNKWNAKVYTSYGDVSIRIDFKEVLLLYCEIKINIDNYSYQELINEIEKEMNCMIKEPNRLTCYDKYRIFTEEEMNEQ